MKLAEKIRGNRKLGFAVVLLGCMFFVLRGLHDERVTMHGNDFLPVYSGARCMVKGMDPYDADALLQVNRNSGVNQDWARTILGYEDPIYPPTSLFLLTPLGAMGWGAAHAVWLWLEGMGFAGATLLVWDLCADDAPVLAGLLLGAFTATSTLLMMTANPTGLAVALCVVGAWCALRQRAVWLGVVCFALSLLLKPQIGGLVWLYFVLSAPAYRRFAWKVLAVTLATAVPASLWVSLTPASQHWASELYRTVIASMAPGGTAAPGIGNPVSYAYWNLQSIFSIVWNHPGFYNWMTYAITGPMILLWIWTVAKSRPGRRTMYVGLAAGVLLSLLPLYHRPYDGRLVLLMFPGAMALWGGRNWKGRLAVGCVVGITGLSLNALMRFLYAHESAIYGGPLWLRLAGRPYPFVMLAVAAIYLWMYVRAARRAGDVVAGEELVFGAAGRPAAALNHAGGRSGNVG